MTEATETQKVSAATIIGPGKPEGVVNQDYYYWAVEDGVMVAAVADGAGSLSLSHLGSTIAAQTAVEETLDCLHDGCEYDEAVQRGFEAARAALMDRDDWKQLGCTLSLTVAGDQGWASGSVGDAFSVILDQDGELTTVQSPRTSEYANITTLMTSTSFDPTIVHKPSVLDAFAVSSDGLLQLSTERGGIPKTGFWLPLFGRVEHDTKASEKFLYWLDQNEHLDDDTTLILVKW